MKTEAKRPWRSPHVVMLRPPRAASYKENYLGPEESGEKSGPDPEEVAQYLSPGQKSAS